MARRLDKTLIDYLVIAISPALIMTLVGSLLFFLLQVFYRGDYGGRLHYIFALFVFATVLLARVSIEEGRGRAGLFAIPLALVTLLALNRFVEFQGLLGSLNWLINLLLMAMVWACADKLTWDCTLIDETERDSGEGLLESAGMEKQPVEKRPHDTSPQPEGVTAVGKVPAGWRQRYREQRRRPHAPGVWVVYFSLAALPLFGLGQWFLPATLEARQHAFRLLFVYVGSGLGLLLTTSFLGLRRYLRQRKIEMPPLMANLWLMIGGILIVGLLAFATLLPRPNPEYAISQVSWKVGSPDRKASRHALGSDGAKDEDQVARQATLDQQEDAPPADTTTKDGTQPPQPGPQGKSTSPDGQKSRDQDGAKHEGRSGQQDDDENTGEGKPDDSQPPAEQQQQSPEETDAAESSSDEEAQHRESDNESPGRATSRISPSHPPQTPSPSSSLGNNLIALAKWLLYAIVIVVGLVWLWRNWAAVLAGLRELAEFWRNLFHRRQRTSDEEANEAAKASAVAPKLFAEFADPFATDAASRQSADQLVRYSFEALEAWAKERACGRLPEQTPHEFAEQVGTNVTPLTEDARKLADLYCLVAYAPGTLPIESVEPLKHLWRQLRSSAT